jgi:anti-repressor protein
VGKDFSNWIKDRVASYEFAENRDFVVFAEIGGNPLGGRPAKEYALSIDMAKELAMVERNERGKQARCPFKIPPIGAFKASAALCPG